MKDGGAAFPNNAPDEGGGPECGMTMRDWIAGKTFAAAMTSAEGLGSLSEEERSEVFRVVANISFEAADAFIAAREAK